MQACPNGKIKTERNLTRSAPFVPCATSLEYIMAKSDKGGDKSKGGKSGGSKPGGSQSGTRATGTSGGGSQSGQKSQSR
jgi:hypothetical protein